jgi:hypothetical protein
MILSTYSLHFHELEFHISVVFGECQDKLSSFWEIKKKEYAQLQAEFRNKDRAMEELEERHQLEIKVPMPSSYSSNLRLFLRDLMYLFIVLHDAK